MTDLFHRMTMVHRLLDDEIRGELKRRFPNHIKLLRLKKLRLAVKDRLCARLDRRKLSTQVGH